MSHCENADKQCFKGEDSLLVHDSSTDTSSPNLSRSGSSLDEGIELGQKSCRKKIFNEESHVVQDKPMDLSLKRLPDDSVKSKVRDVRDMQPFVNFQTADKLKHRIASVTDKGMLPVRLDKASDYLNLCIDKNPEYLRNSAKLKPVIPPPYLPWPVGHGANRFPFPTSLMHALCHPAFTLSQVGRHASALSPYSLPVSSAIGTQFPISDSLSQHQSIMAEFSRIYAQTKTFCGSTLDRGRMIPSMSHMKDSLLAGMQAIALHDDADSTREEHRNGVGLQVKQEAFSPKRYPSIVSRKRKYKDGLPGNDHTPAKLCSPIVQGYSEDCNDNLFCRTSTFPDSPPTMVAKAVPASRPNGQVIPKAVDFKPCRYSCNECRRTYATVGGLMKHSKTHHDPVNSRTFHCQNCYKEYNSLGALKMHIRTHTLPCKCHVCGKAFSRTWLLQGHIRTHTGEKPYKCAVCTRAFADRSNLRAHMQTHETVKRYACKSCDKTFSRISLLNRHQISGCSGTV